MNALYRSAAVAVAQCLLVLSLAGKYALDRERLPRVWVKTVSEDPNLPMRGRYVSLRLAVDSPAIAPSRWVAARLSVVRDRLIATPDSTGAVHVTNLPQSGATALAEPVAFFIPEHAVDPSRRATDEELWAEVTVPAQGVPRPIRLAVKKNGILIPIDLH